MNKKIDVLIDVKEANKQMIIPSLAIFIVAFAIYAFLWDFEWNVSLKGLLIFYAASLVGIVAHELVHGIAFIAIGKAQFTDVKFGVLWKTVTPYAHCKIPLTVKSYKIALLLPAIVTGIVPLIIGLSVGSMMTVIVAAFLTTAGAGDWLIYRKIVNFPNDATIIDHPSEVGCIVALPEDY